MKRIYTNAVTPTAGFLPNIGTLNFLQDSYKEQFNNLIKTLIPYPLNDTIYVLLGCENTGSGSNYNITAGILYYNGEIYNQPAATFTCGVTELPYASIHEDYTYTDQNGISPDPSTLTDGNVLNMHVNRTIVIANGTGVGLPEYNQFRGVGSQWLIGEIKQIDYNTSIMPNFLNDYFDNTGLGKNRYRGWAICNGNNGTRNRKGRVAIGYDETNYPTVGATGGWEDAVVIEHTHDSSSIYGNFVTVGDNQWQLKNINDGSSHLGVRDYGNITGGVTNGATDGIGKNMQPYIVTLFIQKIY